MGGIADLTRRMAILRGETERTKESLGELPAAATDAADGVADGLREVTTEATAARNALQGFRAGGRGAASRTARGDTDADSATAPTFTQQSIIDEIRNTTVGKGGSGALPVGQYLDKFIELYIELLVKGAAQTLTPQRQRAIEEALYARNVGAQDIIRNYGGAAGRKINFYQLEADIKKMLRAQQDMERAIRQGRAPSGSSGTLGKVKGDSCPAQSPLSILLQSGALR